MSILGLYFMQPFNIFDPNFPVRQSRDDQLIPPTLQQQNLVLQLMVVFDDAMKVSDDVMMVL